MALPDLTKVADLVGGTFLGTLEELASNSTVKELIADGEVGTSLLLAAFNEDSFDAGCSPQDATLNGARKPSP
jgi:hypothetical protein